MNNYTTIALSKGRLLIPTIKLLESAEIQCPILNSNSRKLVVTNESDRIKFIFLKSCDIPFFVERGIADMGIVGRL